jgi:hypothetical protein
MKCVIRIEIKPQGKTKVCIGQPKDDQEAQDILYIYGQLQPKIDELLIWADNLRGAIRFWDVESKLKDDGERLS